MIEEPKLVWGKGCICHGNSGEFKEEPEFVRKDWGEYSR